MWRVTIDCIPCVACSVKITGPGRQPVFDVSRLVDRSTMPADARSVQLGRCWVDESEDEHGDSHKRAA